MPYPLSTGRLLIRPLTKDDLGEFVAYRQDPEVARWQSWQPDYSDTDAPRLIESQPTTALPDRGEWIQLAVRDVETGALHGDVAIHVSPDQPDTFEIGVTLATISQNRGIAAEAVNRVLQYLFAEHQAHRIVAFCDTRNEAAARLLRRVGMRQESSQLEADHCKGEWTTLDGYAVLEKEFRTSASSANGA